MLLCICNLCVSADVQRVLQSGSRCSGCLGVTVPSFLSLSPCLPPSVPSYLPPPSSLIISLSLSFSLPPTLSPLPPPRWAPPLSPGRIDEQGNLQCSYHGWSFSPCGACTRIPQLPDSSPAVNSRRACATAFPVRVVFVSVARWDESLVLAVTLPAGIIAFPLSSAHQITKQDCAGIHAYVCVCVCVGEGGWGHACVRVGLCMHACVCTPFDRI